MCVTDIHTQKTTTVTLSAHARRGLIMDDTHAVYDVGTVSECMGCYGICRVCGVDSVYDVFYYFYFFYYL